MATTYLTRTLGSSSNKGTVSMWVKRGALVTTQYLYANLVTGTNYGIIFLDSNDRIEFMTVSGGSHTQKLLTNRVFRDTGSWYHFVFASDTDNATATDRLKLYVNGVEETVFDTDATGSQGDTNYLFQASAANDHVLGASASASDPFDGLMAHVHIVPGYQLTPATFGETDATSGIWTPKTNPTATYTSGGSFLKFENGASMGTDSSGQGNNFTVNGPMTQNVDSPSNNQANLNPLYTIEYKSSQFFTNGNTTTNMNTTQWNTNPCTQAITKGKWYFEGYGHTNSSNYVHYGITSQAKMNANATQPEQEINAQSNGYAYGYYGYNGSIYYSTPSSSTSASYGNTFGSTDYVGIFVDLDNNKLYFSKNGTLQNSGTGYDIHADGKPYLLTTAVYNGLTNVNFGSGVFGTTALTGTTYSDANSFGTFKYSPNQGGAANFDSSAKNFYAMNTKNLKQFGS